MFLYASMLMKGEGVAVDNDEALRYFTLAIKNGYKEKPLQIKVSQQQQQPPPQQQQQPQQKQPPQQKQQPELQKPEKTDKKEKRKSLKKKKQNSVIDIKFVAVGDKNKTSFLMILNDKPFPDRYVPTIYENYQQDVTYNGKQYKFYVWDTAGQDEFDRLRPLSYSGANIVGITFSTNSRLSFIKVTDKWFGEVKHYCKDAALVLIALCMEEYQEGNPDHVSIEEGEKLASELEMDGFLACSPKTGEGMDDVFPSLLRALKSKHKEDNDSCVIA